MTDRSDSQPQTPFDFNSIKIRPDQITGFDLILANRLKSNLFFDFKAQVEEHAKDVNDRFKGHDLTISDLSSKKADLKHSHTAASIHGLEAAIKKVVQGLPVTAKETNILQETKQLPTITEVVRLVRNALKPVLYIDKISAHPDRHGHYRTVCINAKVQETNGYNTSGLLICCRFRSSKATEWHEVFSIPFRNGLNAVYPFDIFTVENDQTHVEVYFRDVNSRESLHVKRFTLDKDFKATYEEDE